MAEHTVRNRVANDTDESQGVVVLKEAKVLKLRHCEVMVENVYENVSMLKYCESMWKFCQFLHYNHSITYSSARGGTIGH